MPLTSHCKTPFKKAIILAKEEKSKKKNLELPDGYELVKDVKEKNLYKTYIPALNLILSGKLDGGIQEYGIVQLAGPSDSFKTIIGLICVKAYLESNPNGKVVVYDAEGGVSPTYFSSVGLQKYVNDGRILVKKISCIEDLRNSCYHYLEDIIKSGIETNNTLFFVDGIGMLPSKLELSNTEDDKTAPDLKRSQAIKSLFRTLTGKAMEAKCPIIVINHSYENFGMYITEKTKLSGGGGSKNSSEMVLNFSKKDKRGDDDIIYNEIHIEVLKSRIVAPKKKVVLQALPVKGLMSTSFLFEKAKELGYIKTSGAWKSLIDPITGEIFEYNGAKTFYEKDVTHDIKFWKFVFQNTTFKDTVEREYNLAKRSVLCQEDEEGFF